MTRERAKELLPVIEAWARGEAVQWKASEGTPWHTVTGKIAADSDAIYRVKPKPREVWLLLNTDGRKHSRWYSDEKEALEGVAVAPAPAPGWKAVKFVEEI